MTTVHSLLVGTTGSGKSTLLKRMALAAIQRRDGALLIDPHGDLADEVAKLVPRRRRNDVVLLDPRRPDTSPGLNPLRGVPASSRAVVVSGILATFKKLWPDGGIGPRSEHLLRYALLALCEVRGATLVDVRDVLADEKRRGWCLKQVRDEEIRRFFTRELVAYGKQLQAEALAAPLNKLGAFIANENVRRVLTKNRPTLDAGRCLVRSRIVVARLSKGAIGEDGAHLLGGLLLGLFQRAVMAREALPREARTPFSIFVDEVGSFATKPFLELLAEARKYGVSLTLATQSLAVMDPETRAGILANIGALVVFRVGGEDARLLQTELVGRYGPETLMKLDVGERVVRQGAQNAFVVPPDAPSTA